MPHVAIQFVQMRQETQDYGSPDEHMLAHLTFNVAVDGEPAGQHTARVRLSPGGEYEADQLEVERPASYRGPMDYGQFRDAAAAYMKSKVGQSGGFIRMGPGVKNATMRNNTYTGPGPVAEFDAPEPGGGW